MTITNICTLKCKECWHLIPKYLYYKNVKLKNYSYEEIEPIIDNLLNSVDKINHFGLLGGEPLLNKDLPLIINKLVSSNKVKKIHIISNGTVKIGEELISFLQNKKIVFVISDYGKLSKQKNSLIEKCKQKKIRYHIRKCIKDGWINTGDPEVNLRRSLSELKDIFSNCRVRLCPLILNGKLYICPKTAHSIELGIYAPKGNEFVDLYEGIETVREKIKKLQNLEYIYGCNYCCGNNGKKIEPAVQYTDEELSELKMKRS